MIQPLEAGQLREVRDRLFGRASPGSVDAVEAIAAHDEPAGPIDDSRRRWV